MLIHSVLCIWCQTFTCLNFAFTVAFSSALHLGNTSIQAKYLKTVLICRFASHNRCQNWVWQIYCNYCKLKNCILQSLSFTDSLWLTYIKSSTVIVETTLQEQLHLCLPSVEIVRNKIIIKIKLSAKIRIRCLIQAYTLICLSKYSIFPCTVI